MISDPIPVEDATSLVIPGTYNPRFQLWENSGPWVWADPINAVVSDSWKWNSWSDFDIEHGPRHHRIARSAIENLYFCGYALVKVLPDPGTPEAKLAEAAAELEASVNADRWEPVRQAMVGDWVDDMRQQVEQHMGVEAGDMAVIDDPAYVAVLDAARKLEAARDAVAAAQARIVNADEIGGDR